MGRHISNTSRIVSVSSSPSSSTDLDLETSIWNKTSSGFETGLGGGGGGEVITTGGGGGDDVALVVVTHARKIATSLPQKGGRDRGIGCESSAPLQVVRFFPLIFNRSGCPLQTHCRQPMDSTFG